MGCVYVANCGECCICADMFSVMWDRLCVGRVVGYKCVFQFSIIDYANVPLMGACAVDCK